ncbi:hypothetical protein FCIRC_2095 [Fusarium circinatum]|uniref:Uncharacterized protein n=1 Tax=Fusarium circinatum TaxID=48490 RepID=A0A8H5XB26_FUSCI|nr:hypothetical protein FCIRC_2095 [Fusarium circinatum]
MVDLKLELQRCTNIEAETVKDSKDLITVVQYLLFGPLCNALSAMEKAIKTSYAEDKKREYRDAVWTLYSSILSAQYELDRHTTTQQGTEEWYRLNSSKSYREHGTFDLPCLSPLELLLRVVTARQKWDSLETLCAAFGELNIATPFTPTRGLPCVAFICMGISPNDNPTYIITASADNWGGYPELYRMMTDMRDLRLAYLYPTYAFQIEMIKDWSSRLAEQYQRSSSSESPETLTHIIENPKGYFTHENDVAVPLGWQPSFRPRDRCTRCQAIFKYAVIQDVTRAEAEVNQGFKGRRPHQKLSCAEVHAHFFCQSLVQNGHSKCELVKR